MRETVSIGTDDRAFSYGDSLFETCVLRAGGIRFWDDHWARLREGMRLLEMQASDSFSAARVGDFLVEVARANRLSATARLRLRVVRRPGGLYAPTQSAVDFFAEAAPHVAPPPVRYRVGISERVRLTAHAWSHCKTGSALPYVLAGLERRRRGLDELLLLDQTGALAEASAANLFWEQDGILHTPDLASGCVGGVMRLQVLRAARAAGVEVREGLFPPEALQRAGRVFTTNAAGLVPLASFAGATYDPALPDWLGNLNGA
ncbi:MAG: aminotransferase class IV [Catalinimonas sp.]